MNYLLQFLPDPYLKRIADYFAAQRRRFPTAASRRQRNNPRARQDIGYVW